MDLVILVDATICIRPISPSQCHELSKTGLLKMMLGKLRKEDGVIINSDLAHSANRAKIKLLRIPLFWNVILK